VEAGLRNSAVAVLLGGGGWLLASQDGTPTGVPGPCSGCGVFADCRLPKAAAFRKQQLLPSSSGGREVSTSTGPTRRPTDDR
ncbi:MAG: hypothetical protein D6741_19840, partial [Planctomycetota bacterium]